MSEIEQRQAERRADVARFHERNVIWCCSEVAERCFEDCELLLSELTSLRAQLAEAVGLLDAAEIFVKAAPIKHPQQGPVKVDLLEAIRAVVSRNREQVVETNIAEQCAEIAERHGYDDAAFAIRSAFPKES